MKKLKVEDLEENESYLIETGYNWSPSGFDIAEFSMGALISQSNCSDLLKGKYVKTIYELPIVD